MPEAALATASVPGVGTGSSAASPVETSPISAPSETVETPDIGVETAEPIAGEQPTESVSTDSPETQETQDGRVIPQEFREAFKQNPKLRNLFFSEKAYREQFPTIQEARQARDLLETVGGEEGWKQVQQSQEEQRGLDDLYYSRNPQKQRDFVKNLLTQDKGAFESIVPVALFRRRILKPRFRQGLQIFRAQKCETEVRRVGGLDLWNELRPRHLVLVDAFRALYREQRVVVMP